MLAELTLSTLLAICTIIPELYARVKSKMSWTPINVPPMQIGDDYHYFSILNQYYNKILTITKKPEGLFNNASANSKYQLAGYLFNLIPFHIGNLIEDRRMGVVVVRLYNRFFLFFIGISTFHLYFTIIGCPPKLLQALSVLSILIYFLFYPGPIDRIKLKDTLMGSLNEKKRIYEVSCINDLTRAMFSETTAPILILNLYFNLSFHQSPSILAITGLTVTCLFLFFHYAPAGLVSLFLTESTLFIEGYLIIGFIILLFYTICFTKYLKDIFKDQICKEVFSARRGGLLIISKGAPIESIARAMVGGLLVYLASRKIDLVCLIIFLSVLNFSKMLNSPHASRIWNRAANIAFQFLCVGSLIGIIANYTQKMPIDLKSVTLQAVIWGVCAILIFLFIRFSASNAKYLFENQSTKWNIRTAKLMRRLMKRKRNEEKKPKIATYSLELAGAIPIFTTHDCLFKNYSIQNHGYRKHLKNILKNFIFLGADKKTIIKWLTIKVDYEDWIYKRQHFKRQSKDLAVYCHTLQYFATNREYNIKLRDDHMYDAKKGWTAKYKRLLLQKWNECIIELQILQVRKI